MNGSQNLFSEKTLPGPDQSESDVSLNLFAKSDNLHRVSCHKCGNVRKRKIYCAKSTCPHVFCVRYVTTLQITGCQHKE